MFQGQGQAVNPVVQLPRIDCGIVIPSQWGLEQFMEMAKALKHIEDRQAGEELQISTESQQQQYCVQSKQGKSGPNSLTSLTSQPSPITPAIPIGNITMGELATKMGSQMIM